LGRGNNCQVSKSHFVQVKKAVGSYAGIEPATPFFAGKCSTAELVCKLFGLGHEVEKPLTIDGFRANNKIATGTAIDDVGLKAILVNIQMIRQPFFHGCIIHSRRNTELRRLQIERTSFKPNMNHRNTSCDRTKKLNVGLVQVCKAVFRSVAGSM
jgi:hypothetical protein